MVRLLPFGERAVLAEAGSLAEVLGLRAALAASRPDGVVDLVPAARTVLVRVDPRLLPVAAARAWIERAAAGPTAGVAASADAVVELPIRYDGDDLAAVAAHLGVTPDEVATRHATAEWTVAFTGFAPGFGYLVSEDWPFDVPRRSSPRTRVPTGAVGLAGEFTGAYPRETPGGWQLIGTTTAPLFDAAAETPALLTPGTRVRFAPTAPAPEDAADAEAGRDRPGDEPAAARTAASAAVRVVDPGLRATLQDQGRAGHAAAGVAASGAADRAALRTAQRLVGTAEDAAGIEIVMGGFRAVALVDLWFAVTGAWGPIRIDGRLVDPYTAQRWPAGGELHVDRFDHGVHGYLAVRGGWDVPRVIGSRSTDTLAGIGPAPLAAGDTLAVGADDIAAVPADDLHPWGAPADDAIEVGLAPGPRADWFAADAVPLLFESVWTVSGDADRVGVRLDGPVLQRSREGELPSEGMVPGAIQVPPSGQPVILGPDGPVTGGYPVIAVVVDASRDALAQARPGTRIRFRHAR
ncbi:5-oxoprolinase/urea amidolyase family protein [Microbacterium sp. PA5]|uniref:5-oxoprolinase/urea amidolyase family protein n=1 Tax=Microbacterium sp. PA5 TaxID=3416654 RepID=UPI003CE67BFF